MNNSIIKKQIWNYVITNYSSEEYYTFLYSNNLQFIFEQELFPYMTDSEKNEHRAHKRFNHINTKIRLAEMCHINNILTSHEIYPIFFKGYISSYMLYDDMSSRDMGDLDLYVDEKNFIHSYNLLNSNGFIKYNNDLEDPHHVKLIKGKTVVELHRNLFLNKNTINTDYILSHTEEYKIQQNKLISLNKTSYLLMMFYHLYIHMSIEEKGINRHYIMLKKIPYFYHRAFRYLYEIAVFIVKYNHEICWADFLEDINKQSLTFVFFELIQNLYILFPGLLDKKVYDYLINKEYKLCAFAVNASEIYLIKNKDLIINPAQLNKKLLSTFWHGFEINLNKNFCNHIPVINSPFFYFNSYYSIDIRNNNLIIFLNIKKENDFNKISDCEFILDIINPEEQFCFKSLSIHIDFINATSKIVNYSNINTYFLEQTDNSIYCNLYFPLSFFNINSQTNHIYLDLHINDIYSTSNSYSNILSNPYNYIKLILKRNGENP